MRSHRTTSRRAPFRPAPAEQRNGRRGFTLIELMVVLLLVGILSSIAVYTYRTMVNKARMTQAKTVLAHLVRMETTYYSDHDRYTDNVLLVDFDPVKYDYYKVSVILDNDAQNYTGIATGIGIMVGDWWTITKDGQPVQADNSVFR